MSPAVVIGDNALNAVVEVVCPVPPFTIARVPVAEPTGMFVQFERLPEAGVPSTGVVKVGLVDSTFEPVPVDVVTPVPPFATANVPVAADIGMLVQLVNTPDAGVPNAGVTNVGLVDNTFEPEPVDVVTPVPPFATARVPANVIAPAVAVDGVSPVVPPLNVVTPPPPPEYCGMLSVVPLKVAAPLVPVVVNVIGAW
jgi:hypothetical protein